MDRDGAGPEGPRRPLNLEVSITLVQSRQAAPSGNSPENHQTLKEQTSKSPTALSLPPWLPPLQPPPSGPFSSIWTLVCGELLWHPGQLCPCSSLHAPWGQSDPTPGSVPAMELDCPGSISLNPRFRERPTLWPSCFKDETVSAQSTKDMQTPGSHGMTET